jgi:hypothetical protein
LRTLKPLLINKKELNAYGYLCYADILGKSTWAIESSAKPLLILFWGVAEEEPHIGYDGYTGIDKSAQGNFWARN